MSDFERLHTGLTNCLCAECYLVSCGVVNADWDGWLWVWLAGEARVAMVRLTGLPPVRFIDPRQDWAGAIPWFDRAGCGLEFDEDGDDELA